MKTWIRREGLASWSYQLPRRADELRAPADRRRVVIETLRAAAAALAPLARVRRIALTPARADEPDVTLAELEPALARAATVDLYVVALDLDVACRTPAGSEWLDDAATVNLFVAVDERGDLETDREWPLVLDLELHVDVFARRTGADDPDNRELAALNAPALAALLARFESALGATLLDVDAEGYPAADARGLG